MHSIPNPRGYLALAVTALVLASALLWPRTAMAASASFIECNETSVGQPCDTDNTVCTRELCMRVGASVECKPQGNEPAGTVCESDDQPCTSDTCAAGACKHTPLPVGTVCFDGQFCTDGETCNAAGVCGGGLPTCDDHDACTTDSCDEAANTCAHGARKVCAPDGNDCSSDDCDPVRECNYAPEPATVSCDDGLFCTRADHCNGEGGCTGELNCVDASACTTDSCDEAGDQCVHVPDVGAACDDGNACTTPDACDAQGQCSGTVLPDSTPCSAGGGCLIGGTCTGGVCSGTSDAPDGTPCDDNDECHVNEACSGGVCGGGMARVCADDSSVCTVEACDPGEGCVAETLPGCADAGPGPAPDAGPGADGGPGSDAAPGSDGSTLFKGDLGGGGCGCDVGGRPGTGTGTGLFVTVFAMWLLWRRRRAALVLLLAGLSLVPSDAHAAGFDAQLFKPATSTTGYISQDGSDTLPAGILHVRLTFDVASDLLVVRDPDTGEPMVIRDSMGNVIFDGKLLASRTGLALGAGYGVGSRLELGAALPMAVLQSGNLLPINRMDDLASTALGDLRLSAKLRVLHSGMFGLAVSTTFVVPTGNDESFTGAGTPVFTPRVIAGVHTGRASLALNTGYALRSGGKVGNLEVDDELLFGAGARFDLQRGRLWLLGEGYTRLGIQGDREENQFPAELLVALRWQVSGPWVIEAGAGFGVTRGYGTPGVREFISIAFAPQPPAPPMARPEETQVEVEEAPPPPPPLDRDHDGIIDDDDKCPTEPEDKDGVEDEDGCPDPDQDGDGILDRDDKCPTEPEVVNGVDDLDGCPDEGLFELKEDRIVLEERVLFDKDRARVKSKGKFVLKAVVVLWNQHPEYEKMIIEGHTDERGSDDYNLKLGQLRAERVKSALVEQGFPADKIEIVSYGRTRPVDTAGTEAAWQKNRRSEFVIVRKTKAKVAPSEPAPTAPTPTPTP